MYRIIARSYVNPDAFSDRFKRNNWRLMRYSNICIRSGIGEDEGRYLPNAAQLYSFSLFNSISDSTPMNGSVKIMWAGH